MVHSNSWTEDYDLKTWHVMEINDTKKLSLICEINIDISHLCNSKRWRRASTIKHQQKETSKCLRKEVILAQLYWIKIHWIKIPFQGHGETSMLVISKFVYTLDKWPPIIFLTVLNHPYFLIVLFLYLFNSRIPEWEYICFFITRNFRTSHKQ